MRSSTPGAEFVMSVDEYKWYVRIRGKTLGPFSWPQLEAMRNRGQLSRFHELSQDRRDWIGAGSLADLFGPDGGALPAPGQRRFDPGFAVGGSGPGAGRLDPGLSFVPSDSGAFAGMADSVSWYHARGGNTLGPVSSQDLRNLAARGEIDGSTMVWREGMAGWAAGRDVPELAAILAPTPSTSSDPLLHPGPPRMSGLAIASLVFGIVWIFWVGSLLADQSWRRAMLLPPFVWLCGVGSLLAVIFGAVSLSQISRSRGALEGKGMAITGLVLGIIGLSLFAFSFMSGFIGELARQAELQRR